MPVAQPPESRFAALAEELAGEPGVVPPSEAGGRRFGAATLRVDGRIFAMLYHERLVVKLPAARVDDLIGQGHGERFARGDGRPMREWLSLAPDSPLEWRRLADEARAFVGAG